MKPSKDGLRIWIAGASIASFMGGWSLLAHAPKPAPLITSSQNPSVSEPALTPLPTLQPLPQLNGSTQAQTLQPLQPIPQTRSFFPRMRTMGS
jgi:hypothetical protein